MSLTAELTTHHSSTGPSVLDLLAHVASQPGEIALLHSSNNSGPSVLAVNPILTMEVDHRGDANWIGQKDIKPSIEPGARHPLHAWQQMLNSVSLLPGKVQLPLIGWIGGISYDIGRHIENLGNPAHDDGQWPLLRFSLFDEYFFFEPQSGRWTLATWEWNRSRQETAAARLARMAHVLTSVKPAAEIGEPRGTLASKLPPEEYGSRVRRAKEYIAAGDIYQANIAQRWSVVTHEDSAGVYRRLCGLSPASHAAYLRFDDQTVISASPELFLERRGNHLVTRPIKGTRPRDVLNENRDADLRRELLESAKDRAELAMIVDLLRNDLGRVCRFGTVKVTRPRELEKLPTVWHTVAQIEGELTEAQCGWGDIVRALCPGGSITGAPKIRAMQIIAELERVTRGWYCGNIGWIGPEGTGALNIAIRTILMRGNEAQVWAGAGIVADSEEEAEYQETLVKARALLRALAVL